MIGLPQVQPSVFFFLFFFFLGGGGGVWGYARFNLLTALNFCILF